MNITNLENITSIANQITTGASQAGFRCDLSATVPSGSGTSAKNPQALRWSVSIESDWKEFYTVPDTKDVSPLEKQVNRMEWKMFQLSSGHRSLENSNLEADDVFTVLHQLKDHFQERLDAGDKMGLEVLSSVATEIWIDGTKLMVGWDNWSGLFIMAWDADGDGIIGEIERFINGSFEHE